MVARKDAGKRQKRGTDPEGSEAAERRRSVRFPAMLRVDYVVGETFSWAQEALIALHVILRAKKTAVITLAMHKADVTREDWTVADACQRLADAGAHVVGNAASEIIHVAEAFIRHGATSAMILEHLERMRETATEIIQAVEAKEPATNPK